MRMPWWGYPAILVTSVLSLVAVVTAMPGKSPNKNLVEHPVAPATLPNGPEPLLTKVFVAIEQNQVDLALRQTEQLVATYPNFRLAHLIKGDLLLARTQPLTVFGQGGHDLVKNKVDDLREEAIARLHGYRSKPSSELLPRYLLEMPPEQKYAIVVDAQRSRLYLYRNDQGIPNLAADYYITQGKLGADKYREGDKRTPIGVYYVTSSLSPRKLGNFYGDGAFPLNYPNEWDKRQGRKGHGIWLHGTPPDTFSRPPKASDGCVVLANPDLTELAKYLQIGLTPVIISEAVEWRSREDLRREREALRTALESWRQDWESRDIDRYASHYSRKFLADNQSVDAWIAQKRMVNAEKTWIRVVTSDISLLLSPSKEDYAVVTFQQNYQSSNSSSQMRKRQYWIKEDGRWKIVAESAA